MDHDDAPLGWLEHSWLGAFARDSLWLYPLAGVAHILGIGLLLGSIVAFDLRILGAAPRIPVAPAVRLLLTLARAGFGLVLVSGVVMLAADATHLIGNPAFVAKAILIGLAGLNVLVFHVGPVRLHRLGAALSLLFWTGTIIAGRMIAYL